MADGGRAVVVQTGYAGGPPASPSGSAAATAEPPAIPAAARAEMKAALEAGRATPAPAPPATPPVVAPAPPLHSSEPAGFAASVMREARSPEPVEPVAADPAAPPVVTPPSTSADVAQMLEAQNRTADAISELVQQIKDRDAKAGVATTTEDGFAQLLKHEDPAVRLLAERFVTNEQALTKLAGELAERGQTQDAIAIEDHVTKGIADLKRSHPGLSKSDATAIARWMVAPQHHKQWLGVYSVRDVANRLIGYDAMDAKKFAGSPAPPNGVVPAPVTKPAAVVETTSAGSGGGPLAPPRIAPDVRTAVRTMFSSAPNAFGKYT